MKKLAIVSLLLAVSLGAFAQEEKEMKTGWSFGVLPTATYSVDNGFQAGLFGDVYYYGDGSTYPDPVHKISWEGSYFTHSHRMRLYLAYDSKYLIPNMRVNASVTYVTDPLYSFWGFNGPAATQNYDIWGNRKAADLLPSGNNINYYGMNRDMLRVLANFQGRITDNLNWAAGINFWHWTLGQMKDNGARLKDANGNYIKDAEGKDKQFYYDKNFTLVEAYKAAGLLSESDLTGGNALELNAGVVFDTRDMEAAPNRGIWAEAYLNGNVIGQQYLKACAYFRHYISIPIHIPAGEPVFAYRLAWQQTIFGKTPFFMIQNVPLLVQRNMISEGFGSSNTIRGLRENRVLAEGMAWINTELRVKLVKFKLFNQYFYVAVNPFFDGGFITKQYRKDELAAAAVDGKIYDPRLTAIGQDALIYDASKAGQFIYSAGAGLKIAMNQNFIVSAEFAKCFTPGLDAGLWIGIGINYQF
ncbi:MAG: hypothetical protein II720_01705 [Bacteroidales bacterium]|nr:hypothetical protein [Bacteroidales bacterium]